MAGIEEIQQMITEPPDWLQEWAKAVGNRPGVGARGGTGLDGLRVRGRSRLPHLFAPRARPDFVVPYYHQLLDRTPKGQADEFRAWRHDEYEDAAKA
jgi:predicted dithiol-disulfide oxidoreductase (DUF899 family)